MPIPHARCLSVLFCALITPPMLSAQVDARTAMAETRDIRAVLDRQAADWNRGDLDAFATGYKNSPDILFIGRTIHRGYAGMLAGYRRTYTSREKMGRLSFSEVEVQPLDARFATVTGRFHLERTPAGGGNDDGFYLLVLEKTQAGWKIVRDDSTGAGK